jgi:hypothetical protein
MQNSPEADTNIMKDIKAYCRQNLTPDPAQLRPIVERRVEFTRPFSSRSTYYAGNKIL